VGAAQTADEFISTGAAAALMGLSRHAVRYLVLKGYLKPAATAGTHRLFRRSQIETLMREREACGRVAQTGRRFKLPETIPT
jgi:excisionase family DNA binding protein